MLLTSYTALVGIMASTGFVSADVELFVLRGLSGLVGGAMGTLVSAALSDYTPLGTRARYQGLQGIANLLGGPIGMLGGSALAAKGLWRWHFWGIMAPYCAINLLMAYLWCPASRPPPSGSELLAIFKTIDYVGIVSLCLAIVSFLMLGTQAGRKWPMEDPRTIAFIILLALSCTTFLLWGFIGNRRVRPVIPFSIFRNGTVSLVFAQQFWTGFAYSTFLLFFACYLGICYHMNSLDAAVHMLPWILVHSVWMALSGEMMSWHRPWPFARDRKISYTPMMLFGFACMGVACLILGTVRSIAGLECAQVILGLGTGSVFQNSIAVLQSHTPREDTAVVLGTRSLVRNIGGSVGTTICSVILAQLLQGNLPSRLKALSQSAFSKPDFGAMTVGEVQGTLAAYHQGFQWVFVACAIPMAVCFLTSFFIEDKGMMNPDIREKERRMSNEHQA